MSTFPKSLGPHAKLDDVVYYLEEEFGGVIESLQDAVPEAPESDGTYVLTCTVASGEATYSWESAETPAAAEQTET